MIITVAQANVYAKNAGFTGNALRVIVAIAQAESGLDTTAVNPTDANGGSYGILQINGIHNVQQADAFDPQFSFNFAYQLSQRGANFRDWTTYRTGAYKSTPAWMDSAGSIPPPSSNWNEATSQAVWPYLFPLGGDRLNPYNPPTETGIDLGMDLHTQIISLTLGTVVTTGWYGGGGVVCVASNVPYAGGVAIVYYQHLDSIAVSPGDIVHVGTLIGLSGGQLSGGEHPVSCCSTGPHLEVGLNPAPGNGDNGQRLWVSYGQNLNPLPWLQSLVANGPPVRDIIGGVIDPPGVTTGTPNPNTLGFLINASDNIVSGTGPVADSFWGIESRIDQAMQILPIDWSQVGNGLHWWDYALPWQWQHTQDTITGKIAQALSHNIGVILLRALVVIIGFLIVVAFFVGVINAAIQQKLDSDGGADKAAAAAKLIEVAS